MDDAMYGFRPIPERLVSEGLDAARPDPELRRMPVFFQSFSDQEAVDQIPFESRTFQHTN